MSAHVRNSGIRKIARQLAVAVILCTGIALPPVLAASQGNGVQASDGDGEWPAPGTNVIVADGEWPAPGTNVIVADGEWPAPTPALSESSDGEWPAPQG